jgi:hypothetical protein
MASDSVGKLQCREASHGACVIEHHQGLDPLGEKLAGGVGQGHVQPHAGGSPEAWQIGTQPRVHCCNHPAIPPGNPPPGAGLSLKSW